MSETGWWRGNYKVQPPCDCVAWDISFSILIYIEVQRLRTFFSKFNLSSPVLTYDIIIKFCSQVASLCT